MHLSVFHFYFCHYLHARGANGATIRHREMGRPSSPSSLTICCKTKLTKMRHQNQLQSNHASRHQGELQRTPMEPGTISKAGTTNTNVFTFSPIILGRGKTETRDPFRIGRIPVTERKTYLITKLLSSKSQRYHNAWVPRLPAGVVSIT